MQTSSSGGATVQQVEVSQPHSSHTAAAPIVWETVEEPARTFEMPYASDAMMNAQEDSEKYGQKHARLFGMVSVPEGGGGNGGGRGRGRGGGRGGGRFGFASANPFG